jgi:hypothetical protein
MNRRLSGRLERLESRIGTVPDVASEVQRYGPPLWSVPGFRAYSEDGASGARLSVVSPAGTVSYEVTGISLGDLA